MGAAMGKVAGRADGKRVSASFATGSPGSLRSLARRQLTLENDVAAELAGSEDSVLRELEERIGCDVFLRGNVLTLDGDEGDVGAGGDASSTSSSGLIERGHELAPQTIDSVTGRDRRRRAFRARCSRT